MSSEDKRSGQKIALWSALGVLVGIVAIVVAIVIRPPKDRDFTMSVTPMHGRITQGGVTQTSIYVKGEGGYKHSVNLSASGQPSDVQIAFSPPFAPASPAFTSTMLVNVETKATPDECEITIKGIGEDGREHSCKYTLNIIERERDVIFEKPPEIKIISPKRDEEVPLNVTVTGSFSGDMPEDRDMWVIINPHPSPGQWWLQGGKIEPWGGRWSVPATLGREEEDKGQGFDIAVILVNEEDNKKNESHLETAQATGEYPSISLPRSAAIMDRITVKRK